MIEKRLDGTLVFDSVQELKEYEGEKGKAQEKAWATRKKKYGYSGMNTENLRFIGTKKPKVLPKQNPFGVLGELGVDKRGQGNHKTWMPKDKKLLKGLWLAGVSRLQMKKALGRTWLAIYQQALALGLTKTNKKRGKVNKVGSSPYSRFMGVAIKKALDSGAKSPQEAMQMAIAEWNKQKSNGKGETNEENKTQ
jgi:hypothetical protein